MAGLLLSGGDLSDAHRAAYARTRGGLALFAAEAAYWFGLLLVRLRFPDIPIAVWMLPAFAAAPLIPLAALVVGRVLGAPTLRAPPPFGGLAASAMAATVASGVLTLALFVSFPEVAPLALAVSLSLYAPAVGWMCGRTGLFLTYVLGRSAVCAALWFVFPALVVIAIPSAAGAACLLMVIVLAADTTMLRRRRTEGETDLSA